jgi:hypothetical protein
MKNLQIIKMLGVSALILAISSCSLDPVIHSQVTNYPIMSLKGDATIFVPLGGTYNDPGIVATENGAPIPFTSTGAGKYRNGKTLDLNVADEYVQTYKAVNKDGFARTIDRKVIVYKNGDLVNSIEGVYLSTTRRNGSLLPASQGSSVDQKYVYVWKNSNGTYGVSDAFGGWYDIGRKIGVTSATRGGTIAGNIPTNTFTFPGNPLTNVYFGGVAAITGLTVAPASKQLTLSCSWDAGPYTFVSTLTQFQP